MNGNNIIRKQQFINMLYNFIAFTLIFTAFGAIVQNQVRSSLYSRLDTELRSSLGLAKDLIISRYPNSREPSGNKPGGIILGDIGSPRAIPLLRDSTGRIINFGSVNSAYYEQYLQYMPFSSENVSKITTVSVNGRYFFRSLVVPVTAADGTRLFLQLVINADSERALLEHVTLIIRVSIIVFIALSILASHILSQKTMKPVKAAWNKQVEFVENVSHELRTPLTVMLNSLEAMLTTPQARIVDKSETLALVMNETTRLSRLVTDMLTLARSDGTMTELSKDLFSVDALVRNVCEPYMDLAQSQEKSFLLDLDCPANITADKVRINQLLVILLDNALKYTDPHDSITVRTSLEDGRVSLTVADTGIGIGDNALDKVFDRFYREDRARVHDRNGTGLGLSIARWIADRHGGTIKVRHNEPKGSVFTVRLPR